MPDARYLQLMLVGYLLYDEPLDNGVLSYAIAAFLVAGIGYISPPNAQTEILSRAGDRRR